ncbi:hypothetical protein BH10PSE18_BH10PSE18_05010 [soil metagenome]
MSDDERRGEDVAGLFRKFGGDAKGYREFATEPQMNEPTPSWRLVSGARQGAAAPQPAPAAAPSAPAAPALAPVVAATAAVAAASVKSLFARPAAGVAVAAPFRAVAPQPATVPPTLALNPSPTPETTTAQPAYAMRELDVLFSRLNGEPPPQAPEPGGAGLLSRWRRPS